MNVKYEHDAGRRQSGKLSISCAIFVHSSHERSVPGSGFSSGTHTSPGRRPVTSELEPHL